MAAISTQNEKRNPTGTEISRMIAAHSCSLKYLQIIASSLYEAV